MIYVLDPVTPNGLSPGRVDWSKLNARDSCQVKIANYNPNALKVRIGTDWQWLLPWSADVFPVNCHTAFDYEQIAISSVAALPAGATPSLLVMVATGDDSIPGIYPLPLYGTLPLDTLGADIQDLVGGDDAAVAGATGLAADAGHRHPARTEGAVSEATRGAANVRFGIKSGTPRVIFDDGVHVWEIDQLANVLRIFTPGSVLCTIDATGHVQAANYAGPTAAAGTHGGHVNTDPHAHALTLRDNGGVPAGVPVYFDGVGLNASGGPDGASSINTHNTSVAPGNAGNHGHPA